MKTLLSWLLALLLAPILAEMLADIVPGGRLLVPVLLLLGSVRLLLVLFIGGRAADHAVGRLAYDVISLPFRVVAAGLGLIVRAARPDRW